MRISRLRENQLLKLDEKIDMYEKILLKLNTISSSQDKSQQLLNRKIFLEWDIDKRRNDYDLQILR